eukprot:3661054-Lingulodinium_polyedra.AAC.1
MATMRCRRVRRAAREVRSVSLRGGCQKCSPTSRVSSMHPSAWRSTMARRWKRGQVRTATRMP